MGTGRLYRFAHRNPAIHLRATSYTHDALVLGNFRCFVAINGALEVDLTGQVCADSIGPKFYSGAGGQVDFIRGRRIPKAANRSSPFHLRPRMARSRGLYPC